MDYLADIHGEIRVINDWIKNNEEEMYLCVLGDSGVNFYEDYRDVEIKESMQYEIERFKKRTNKEKKILFVRGNHEARPEALASYKRIDTPMGAVYNEEAYPNLYFLIDGELYQIESERYFILGGGFSPDGFERILNNYKWWNNEELSDIEFSQIMASSEEIVKQPIIVLSHMLPTEMVKSNRISNTEKKLQLFLEKYQGDIKEWYAGHYHRRETIWQRGIRFEIVYNKISKLHSGCKE